MDNYSLFNFNITNGQMITHHLPICYTLSPIHYQLSIIHYPLKKPHLAFIGT